MPEPMIVAVDPERGDDGPALRTGSPPVLVAPAGRGRATRRTPPVDGMLG
jgi:hypothetical protein